MFVRIIRRILNILVQDKNKVVQPIYIVSIPIFTQQQHTPLTTMVDTFMEKEGETKYRDEINHIQTREVGVDTFKDNKVKMWAVRAKTYWRNNNLLVWGVSPTTRMAIRVIQYVKI